MQSFQATGLWYLSSDPDRLIAGTLDFSREGGLRLRLSGTLSESSTLNNPDRYEAVYGVLESSPLGRFVLATGCLRVKYSMSMPGYSTEELAPTIAFVSSRPLETETIEARSAEIRLSGLDEWAHVGRGLEIKAEQREPLQFKYSQPDELIAGIDGSTCGLRFLASWSRTQSSFEFRQHAAWVLAFPIALNVDAVRARWLAPLQNMISWMSDRPSGVVDLSVGVGPSDEESGDVHVLYAPVYWGAEEKEQRGPHEMLVTLRDFETTFASVIEEWWTFHQRFRRFCDVFFSLQYAPPRFVEMRFAWLLRAIAAFASAQASEFSSTRPTASAVAEMLSTQLEDQHSRAEDLLPVAHELLLPTYLETLTNQYRDLAQALTGKSTAQFVDQILRLRSLMLWGSGSSSVSGQEIFWTGERLAMLLKVAIGTQLPSLRPKLGDCFARNARFVQLVQKAHTA